MVGLQVSELGGGSVGKGGGKPAKGKDKDAPAYSEVCEACKVYLDADIEIPLPLMARLIKFRLLIIKDADVKSRKARSVVVYDVSILIYYSLIREMGRGIVWPFRYHIMLPWVTRGPYYGVRGAQYSTQCIFGSELLTGTASVVLQGGSDSPKKGDKTDRTKSPTKAGKPEPKKPAADAAASPKTESKLKKRGELELEAKFISK